MCFPASQDTIGSSSSNKCIYTIGSKKNIKSSGSVASVSKSAVPQHLLDIQQKYIKANTVPNSLLISWSFFLHPLLALPSEIMRVAFADLQKYIAYVMSSIQPVDLKP